MATKIYLKKDTNQVSAVLPNWTSAADIYGATAGNEIVNIHVTSSDLSNFSAGAMTLDQNIDGVYLSQALTAYQFAANGNEVSIKLGSTVIAKVTVQDDTNGTAITYAGQTTPIALTIGATSNGFGVKLGEQVLTSTPTAYGETPNPSTGSSEQAPWTLVMGASGYSYNGLSYLSFNNTFVSDSTAAGTGTTSAPMSGLGSASGTNGTYIASADKKHAYWSTGSKGGETWSVSATNATPVKISSTAGIGMGSMAPSIMSYAMANGYTFFNSGLATDGTAAHTFTSSLGTILQVEPTTNTIWHTMTTAPYGTELYKTVLSDTGFTTSMVKDIYAGSTSSVNYTNSKLLPNGNLLFVASDGLDTINNVFVSDGTEIGTYSLDLPYNYGWEPISFTSINSLIAFVSQTRNLTITDGTKDGTKTLDVWGNGVNYSPTILGTINDKLYFTATDATGKGLFSTDGSTFTKLVAISDTNAQILGYTANKAYFAISDNSTNGKELWAVDLNASTPSIALVKDILAGSGDGLAGYNNTYQMIGDKILFNAYISGTNQALFVSDGTEAGTVQLASSLPTDKTIIGNKVFFANSEGVSVADVSTATVSATQLKAGDFSTSTNTLPVLDRLQSDSDQAFFLAGDEKLYVSTGTDAIELASNVDKFKVVADNAIYFIETNSSNVASLWYSDGTASGTRYIEDLTLSASSYDLANAVAIHTVGVSAG